MTQAATLEAPVHADGGTTQRYARCIDASKRVRWDIDRDVIRGRSFEFDKKFLPDGMSRVNELAFLQPDEKRFLSQIQGRTYANIFALVERYIGAKTMDLARGHAMEDQVARGSADPHDRRGAQAPGAVPSPRADGGRAACRAATGFVATPNDMAAMVLGKSTWAVLALTLDIEIFTQVHYRSSIESDANLSRAVEGRLPVPLEGGVAARDPRRAGVAPRACADHAGGARCGRRRPDRAGRGGGRHGGRAGRGRRRLLPRARRPHVLVRAGEGDPRRDAPGLPLAVRDERRRRCRASARCWASSPPRRSGRGSARRLRRSSPTSRAEPTSCSSARGANALRAFRRLPCPIFTKPRRGRP